MGTALVAAPLALLLYTYVGYPLLLRVLVFARTARDVPGEPQSWPTISITVPVYNERAQVADLIESLLSLDYPADRRQILMVSDASEDGTDEVIGAYADRGVESLRMPRRSGKTAAENAAALHLRGEIVVNTDASIRIATPALKRLVATFADPRIGAASGRDISVAREKRDANAGEAGYVGYEMWIRGLETRVAGIVGASGCFYAIRRELHLKPLPDWLSRDFAAAMITRQHGYRTVSVDDAVCYVPRTASLKREYRRKVRTMSRGIDTVLHLRHMLNPLQYGWFSWMLFSHKICRWLVPWSAVVAVLGLAILSGPFVWARWALAFAGAVVGLGTIGWLQSHRPLPRWVAVPAYVLAGNMAAIHAAVEAMLGDQNAIWEPTRRDTVQQSPASIS